MLVNISGRILLIFSQPLVIFHVGPILRYYFYYFLIISREISFLLETFLAHFNLVMQIFFNILYCLFSHNKNLDILVVLKKNVCLVAKISAVHQHGLLF